MAPAAARCVPGDRGRDRLRRSDERQVGERLGEVADQPACGSRTPRRAGRRRCAGRAAARTGRAPRRAAHGGRGCRPARSVQARNAPSPAGRPSIAVRLGRVAAHEPVAHSSRSIGGDGADHARVVGRQEPDERDHQQARVELRREPYVLRERAAARGRSPARRPRRGSRRAARASDRPGRRGRSCSTP